MLVLEIGSNRKGVAKCVSQREVGTRVPQGCIGVLNQRRGDEQ
jgi:hypothetical protein